jgi:DNA replication and repair protein RecF
VGLLVKRLTLKDFRNYRSFVLEPDDKLTVLTGPNAAGKTNVIEAVELVTAADSFRHPQWGDLVRWGSEEAAVILDAQGEGRELGVSLRVNAAGRRTYEVNGKARRRLTEVAGMIPCVVFTPDDLRLVKDSADRRRAAIDGLGDQLSPAFMSSRLHYERVVRQRNAELKKVEPDPAVMDALTSRLVSEGALFSDRRRRLFDRIAEKMSGVYGTLAPGEHLVARYVPSWERWLGLEAAGDTGQLIRSGLEMKRTEERARGITLLGPHRDDVEFQVNGHNARSYASQGQARTIALSWKLAEVAVVEDVAGQAPVLLLDDVMSELDEARRHALALFVGGAAQTFVTTTNLSYFEEDLIARAKVVSVT